ncbi:MAG: 30S ribosomal protein S16 [bacterium]|nr:30S ribosomal protein S16 [bacterium]
MLKIRMQRTGRINTPSYRIVVVEHTASPKAGKFVDKVGTYDPKSKQRVLNTERIKHWLSVGAQPSATVHNMLVSLGIIEGKKINVLPKYKEPAPAVAEAMADKKEEVAADVSSDLPAEASAKAGASAKEEEAPKEEAPAAEPENEEAAGEAVEAPAEPSDAEAMAGKKE